LPGSSGNDNGTSNTSATSNGSALTVKPGSTKPITGVTMNPVPVV